MDKETIHIYTDGSSRGNPGPGGYGTILEYQGKTKELSEGFRLTTNNRMELLAVIVGLEEIKDSKHQIIIYSDSKYVVDAVNKNWVFNWEKNNISYKTNLSKTDLNEASDQIKDYFKNDQEKINIVINRFV